MLLVIGCSVLELHKRALQVFLGAFTMYCASCLKLFFPGNEFFGCGFLVLGRFSLVLNVLGLFLMFGLGLKFLQFGLTNKGLMKLLCHVRGKSIDLRGGICSKHDLHDVYDPKNRYCRFGSLKLLEGDLDGEAKYVVEEDRNEKEKEICPEDEELDAMALTKLVKIERRRAKAACQELEKERTAAASAADEAMAMILRLQSEKSSIEIDANQYKRMAEQKQEYDQQVIESLQWIVMKHESERSLLENQLQLCKQKLKLCMKDDELQQFEVLLRAIEEDDTNEESVCSHETET